MSGVWVYSYLEIGIQRGEAGIRHQTKGTGSVTGRTPWITAGHKSEGERFKSVESANQFGSCQVCGSLPSTLLRLPLSHPPLLSPYTCHLNMITGKTNTIEILLNRRPNCKGLKFSSSSMSRGERWRWRRRGEEGNTVYQFNVYLD